MQVKQNASNSLKSEFYMDAMTKMIGCTFYDGKIYCVDKKGRIYQRKSTKLSVQPLKNQDS